jgi:hypothetical protein
MKGLEAGYARRVGDMRDEPLYDLPQEKKEKPPEVEISAYEREARAHVDGVLLTGKMNRFLGDAVSFTVGKSGSGFYYDSIRKKMNFDPVWFMERNLSPRMIEWAMYHEGRHSLDRRDDPEEFDATLGYCRDKASSYLPMMLDKWKEALDFNDPEQQTFFDSLTDEVPLDPGVPLTAPRAVMPLTKVYFSTLFNSLDDIWVNKGIPNESFVFEEDTEGGGEVREMYRGVLFSGNDYRNRAHVEQFAYTLLRKAMVHDEEVHVNDTVAGELGTPRKYLGKALSAQDIVETFLVPRPGKDTSHGKRRDMIEKYLMDSFDRMVLKDIEAWTPRYPKPQSGKGGGTGEKGEGSPSAGQAFNDVVERQKEHEIDHFSTTDRQGVEQVIDDKAKKERAQAQDAELSPEERAAKRAKEAKEAQARASATENGEFNQPKYDEIIRSLRSYEKHRTRVEKQIEALAHLWRTLIGRGKELRMTRERFHTKGRLDLKAFIAQYPALMKGEFGDAYEPHVFEKRVGEYIERITPEEIRVYLNLDLSGSMTDNPEKMLALKDLTVLLSEAFKYLQTMVQNEKASSDDEHPFRIRFAVRGYDTDSKELLSAQHGWVDEALLMSELDKSGGGNTDSSSALTEVETDLSPIDRDRISSGKVKILLFDVTDGETRNADIAHGLVERMQKEWKVITNPLYLGSGDVKKDEKGFAIMKEIYGDDAEQVTLESIISVLTRRLENELKDIAV